MRVAVVAETTVHHGDADAAERLDAVATALRARGHEVAVLCDQWWEGSPREFEDGGLRYVGVADDDPDWRFSAQLPARLRVFDPDIIHAAHRPPHAVFGAKVGSLVTGAPLIVDWYDHRALPGWRSTLTAGAARLPDAVVAPSRFVETRLRELGRADVEVVPSGVDMEAIRSTEPESVADVVFARRLDEDANLESLLLALAELREVDWTAAVVGDGPARADYEAQAADLRIDDRLTFLGDLPESRRIAIYRGAHVFVQTARYTPFATELLRALACGCVGIAEYHAESAAHELVEHRERGFRVTTEQELARAIRSAAELPRLDVDEDFAAFDEREVLERYLERYRALLSARGLL